MENQAASEILLDTAKSIFEAVATAKQVPIQRDNFMKFSSFLEKAAVSLQDISDSEILNHDASLEKLNTEIESARRLCLECIHGNKMYLFLSCKRISEDLEKITKNISRAVTVFTWESSHVSSEAKEIFVKLCNDMLDAEYGVSELEEEILQKIEKGIEDRNTDRIYATDLLVSISQYVGIPGEHNILKEEFEYFKEIIGSMESRADASRMEQIILLLSNADIITTPKEKETKYYAKRNSLGSKIREPLPSFLCPITGDVMQDPVETSLGHTFERSAIMKWLKEGKDFCPMTKMPLNRTGLRPNKTLRQSIEEWQNRNIMIRVASMKSKIQSNDDQEVLGSLTRLLELCNSCVVHREWIVMEDYVPIIAGILCEKNGDLRMHALEILYCLAKDGDSIKERIAKVNDSITYIVRSLARKVEESVLALQLLLELSRSTYVRDLIGEAQGCILLLVTLANSYDAQASNYAQEVLDNLAFLDQNVIQMARSKFFKPLLQRLCEGPLSVQISMAEALADVELTDHNKLSLCKDGALTPLLQMLLQTDTDVKSAAVRALENLSGIAENGIQLIKGGAKTHLFELLFCHTPSPPAELRERVAKLIMHMAESTTSSEAFKERILLLENEDDVFKLFSLISYSAPGVQETLLLTFRALCSSSCGLSIRMHLREICAVKILIHLCELDGLAAVRRNAVKLLYHLTQDGDHGTFSEHVNEKCIINLLEIIRTSDDEKETSSAMGIISNLPQSLHISQTLFESGALNVISDCLMLRNTHSSREKELLENASQALNRFTVPSNIEWQKKVAEMGLIPVLVRLLAAGSSLTRQHICVSLKQLSENSAKLSLPVKRAGFLMCCMGSSDENTCPVHVGVCGVESSFCLLEAKAINPLVMVLGENDDEACEASLDAILTLVEGVQLQEGCKVIDEAGGISAIIKMLNSSTSTGLQEKGLGALQRIFRLVEFKTKYAKSAEVPLVDITQKGSRDAKSLAAKILVQLNVLNDQSSFF